MVPPKSRHDVDAIASAGKLTRRCLHREIRTFRRQLKYAETMAGFLARVPPHVVVGSRADKRYLRQTG